MAWSPLPGSDGPPPKPVSGLLDSVLAGLGGPTVDVVVAIHARWADIVGAEVVAHAEASGVTDGCLGVVVDSPAWASHLRWSEREILARLDDVVGPGAVTSVSVSVKRR